jgi:hypothetical protein
MKKLAFLTLAGALALGLQVAVINAPSAAAAQKVDCLPHKLAALNTAGDGRVTYCHATSSATNPYVIITTSVSACKAHTDHRKLEKGGKQDLFAGDVCQD